MSGFSMSAGSKFVCSIRTCRSQKSPACSGMNGANFLLWKSRYVCYNYIVVKAYQCKIKKTQITFVMRSHNCYCTVVLIKKQQFIVATTRNKWQVESSVNAKCFPCELNRMKTNDTQACVSYTCYSNGFHSPWSCDLTFLISSVLALSGWSRKR